MSKEVDYRNETKQSYHRKFHETLPTPPTPKDNVIIEKDNLMKYIYTNCASYKSSFVGPFGSRRVFYCDYTASGQALDFIEDFIKKEVLPFYGNIHTTTSASSLQTILFRHESKDIIRNAVRAGEQDAVIFCGSGCTAAVHKLIHALDIAKQKVIVFVGPYEHHSNLLPWYEIGAEVIRISESSEGGVNLKNLESELKKFHNKGYFLIGSFNAASNITGIFTDDKLVTITLHKYGALAFWDYAAAGPYVDIDMNPIMTGSDQGLAYKDAIFLSPHKFVGGPDTPGLLIAKKKLFTNKVPSEAGGGTVFFVGRTFHRYLKEIEVKEEGGTPSIIGAIRAGMVFQLKRNIGSDYISKRDKEICKKVFDCWTSISNLKLLGTTNVERLPIFSFLIFHPQSKLYLHHNFVCAILNDLFGIQSRGGCACSGPYALDLLGIDEELAKKYDSCLTENENLDRAHLRRFREYSDVEFLRPGFTRLNIPYFMSDSDVDYVIQAVSLVAMYAWKLLPQYVFNAETGEWRHKENQVYVDRKWLGTISYENGSFSYTSYQRLELFNENDNLEFLEVAKHLFENATQVAMRMHFPEQNLVFPNEFHTLRWFLLPNEAQQCLISNSMPCQISPFYVRESLPDENSNYNEEMDNSESVHLCKSLTTSSRWFSPPKKIFNLLKKAVEDFDMIKDNDKILICLSGGKDSLSLLHSMYQYKHYARSHNISFELGAVTVDPKSPSYDPSPLKPYLASLNIPYFYEEQEILRKAIEVQCKSICSFCSRLRRGRIYKCARREGYNVVALGQHLDDLSESFIMSVFHNGRLRTIKANYVEKEESLRVIRPFVYVRERDLRKFAEQNKLPVIAENCPACFEAPKERHRVKQLLAAQEIKIPKLFLSLRRALYPLMAINQRGVEDKIAYEGLIFCDTKTSCCDDCEIE